MKFLIALIFGVGMGITLGIPVGLVLSDIFYRWSARIVAWIYRKFGWH